MYCSPRCSKREYLRRRRELAAATAETGWTAAQVIELRRHVRDAVIAQAQANARTREALDLMLGADGLAASETLSAVHTARTQMAEAVRSGSTVVKLPYHVVADLVALAT